MTSNNVPVPAESIGSHEGASTITWQAEIAAMKDRELGAQRRIAQLEQAIADLTSEPQGHKVGHPDANAAETPVRVESAEARFNQTNVGHGEETAPARTVFSRRGLVRLAGASTAIAAATTLAGSRSAAAAPVFGTDGTAFQAPLTVLGGGATFNSAYGTYVGGLVAVGPDGTSIPAYPDGPGSVWAKVRYSGAASSWRKIAGFDTAGALHVISPVRVYDSRKPSASSGLLTNGATRTVSVANALDINSGAVTVANQIPAGARAVVGNLTVIASVGGGFLFVAPGGTTSATASTINWASSPSVTANGFTCALNDTRQLIVFASDGIQCHFIIDISGYYL
jgi:hypothetical protein